MKELLPLGFLILLVGLALLTLGVSSQGNASVGGFFLIGPIPIAFGSGPNGEALGFFALVMGIVMFAALYIYVRRLSSGGVGSDEETHK